jgi:hypothetical protein
MSFLADCAFGWLTGLTLQNISFTGSSSFA